MHVSYFSMRKPFRVHCCCHKAVMIATESVCFQADPRTVLNANTHSQSATPTQQLTSAPLTKCSLTLQVYFRDHMFPIEIYSVIHILGAATDGCRSRPCLTCPPLHGAPNCRCSQTLAPFYSHCTTGNFVNTLVHVNKTTPRR